MMSRMCVESDHWQNNLVEKIFGWKNILVTNFFWCHLCTINLMPTLDVNLMPTLDINKKFHFWPMVDGQLTSTVDNILMSMQHVFTTGAWCLFKNNYAQPWFFIQCSICFEWCLDIAEFSHILKNYYCRGNQGMKAYMYYTFPCRYLIDHLSCSI